MRLNCPAWPTKRRKAARSSCWPKRNTGCADGTFPKDEADFIPFSAYTRMSGVDFEGRRLRKGATDAICKFVRECGGQVAGDVQEMSDRIARNGGTPLAVADGKRLLGIIHLKDIVKGGMKERIAQLRRMGIRTRHDHGRQSADRGCHRRRSRRGRFSRPGHAQGQSSNTSKRNKPPAAWSR